MNNWFHVIIHSDSSVSSSFFSVNIYKSVFIITNQFSIIIITICKNWEKNHHRNRFSFIYFLKNSNIMSIEYWICINECKLFTSLSIGLNINDKKTRPNNNNNRQCRAYIWPMPLNKHFGMNCINIRSILECQMQSRYRLFTENINYYLFNIWRELIRLKFSYEIWNCL